jgi:glutathione synthase/RimK-type ligase-like ATP-grasp enzyme
MILILSDENDLHANYAEKILSNESINYVRLNLNKKSLLSTTVSFLNGIWEIENESYKFSTDKISCVWNRRTYVELLLEEHEDTTPDFKIWKNEWNKTLLGIYTSLQHIKWLNYYRNSQRAENKYLQMQIAKELGFTLPNIIISNNKTELLEFTNRFGAVALKLMHQDFYKTASNDFKGLYVNRLEQKDLYDFQQEGENPIVLQEYIDKKYEVRYTVIENTHLVCKIDSQNSVKTKHDWRRYDLANTPHSIIKAPEEIATKVANFMKKLEINYGALDFIVDNSDNWYFLEVNSMGQYLWIEDLTGLPITRTICDWLIQNSK